MLTQYRVIVDGINVRIRPSLHASATGVLNRGDIVQVGEVANAHGFEWAHHKTGWSAMINYDNSWSSMERLTDVPPPQEPDLPPPDPVVEPTPLFTEKELVELRVIIASEVAKASAPAVAAAVTEALKPYRLHADTMAESYRSLNGYMRESEIE